jgi:hypothetical protein
MPKKDKPQVSSIPLAKAKEIAKEDARPGLHRRGGLQAVRRQGPG